jgi:hypothetical protein
VWFVGQELSAHDVLDPITFSCGSRVKSQDNHHYSTLKSSREPNIELLITNQLCNPVDLPPAVTPLPRTLETAFDLAQAPKKERSIAVERYASKVVAGNQA